MNKVDIFIQLNGKFFEVERIAEIRRSLEELSDLELDHFMALDLKNPTVVFMLSLFFGLLGLDRFILGNFFLGLGKLLISLFNLGSPAFMIFWLWHLIDLFCISSATKEANFRAFKKLLLKLKEYEKKSQDGEKIKNTSSPVEKWFLLQLRDQRMFQQRLKEQREAKNKRD